MGRLIIFFTVIMGLLLCQPVRGDVVILKSGAKVVGTVVDRDADPVRIKTQFSEEVVPRSRIERIEPGPTPWDEFEARLEKADKKSLAPLAELMEWAEGPERAAFLGNHLKRLYRMILRLDPDHEAARKGLGYVRIEGEWVSREEQRRRQKEGDAARAEEEARRRAEEERLERLRRAEGDVGLQMEMNRERDAGDARQLSQALAAEFQVGTSKRISIAGHFAADGIKSLLELGEKALTEVGRELGKGEAYNPGRAGARGVFHQFFVKPEIRTAMINFYRRTFGGISEAFYQHLMKGGGGITAHAGNPYAVAIDIQGLNRADHLLHQLGHILVNSLGGGADGIPWLEEGMGMYMSIRFTGNTGTSCTTVTKYAHEMDVAKKADASTWALVAREQVAKGDFPRFPSLMEKPLNRLDFRDLARSWVLCRFLMEKRPEKFRDFMAYAGPKREAQERALSAALGWTPDQFDQEANRFILEDLK